MTEPTLKISEVFYSLQGEGARAGEASIFIRLQGCSAKHACYASGVVCDTEFESGEELEMSQIIGQAVLSSRASGTPDVSRCNWLVFTGGEPLDQLMPEHLEHFQHKGYKIAIETSGIKLLTKEMADLIDHISLSPKVAEHVLEKHFGHIQRPKEVRSKQGEVSFEYDAANVDELRYVRHAGQPGVPEPSLIAKHYYLSPHSDGAEINQVNLQHCIKLCLENPQWRLSVQSHKIWKLL